MLYLLSRVVFTLMNTELLYKPGDYEMVLPCELVRVKYYYPVSYTHLDVYKRQGLPSYMYGTFK